MISTSNFRKHTIFFAFSIVLSFLSASCGVSKFSECQQIIEIATDTANQTKEISSNGTTKDLQEVLQVADAFEAAAQNMEIQDKELLNYQGGFIKFYRNQAKATRDFIAAFNQKDVSTATSAKEEVQKLGNTEKDLVNGINSYCKQN
jgi:hypothetical protein